MIEVMDVSGSTFFTHTPRILPDMLPRHRLYQSLLPVAAITVIRGPGGSGKTVLLSQIADQLSGASVVWVDAQSADISEVVHNLISEAQPTVLLIDDAHKIEDPSVFRDVLSLARDVSTMSFMIASRAYLPALEDPAEALTLDIRLILPDDLRFTHAEIAELTGASSQRAEELRRLTAGNALFLRALQLGARNGPEQASHSSVADVLRAHVERYVKAAGEDSASFMRRTSLSEDFQIFEAAEISGASHAALLIAQLEAAGLLIRNNIDGQEHFSYPPVMREVLCADLVAAESGRVEALHGIVARHRANREDLAGALYHALLARDFDFAARILLRGGTDLLRSVPYEAFETIPLRIAAHHPLLAAGRALKENARGARWVAREFFAAAIVAARSIAVRNTPERASMAVIESVSARLQGRMKESAAVAKRAMDLIDRLGTDSLLGDQIYALMSACAVSFFRAGARLDLQQILERVPPRGMPGGRVASSLRALTAIVDGDANGFAEVERMVRAEQWPHEDINGYRGALFQLALMMKDLAEADTERARSRVHDIRAHLPTLEFRVLFAAAEALAALIDGAPEDARRIVANVRSSEHAAGRLTSSDDELVSLVDALALAAGGWIASAQKCLNTVSKSSPWGRIARAHLALLQQDHAEAARHLAVSEVADAPQPRIRHMRLLLLAWLSMETGDEESARRSVLGAGNMIQIFGEDGSLMLLPLDVREQLTGLLDGDTSVSAEQARAQLLSPLPSPFHIVASYPRLSKRERVVLSQLHLHGSNAEIAVALDISPNTVKTQLRSAYRKLGVANRSEALVRMAVLGITSDVESSG